MNRKQRRTLKIKPIRRKPNFLEAKDFDPIIKKLGICIYCLSAGMIPAIHSPSVVHKAPQYMLMLPCKKCETYEKNNKKSYFDYMMERTY